MICRGIRYLTKYLSKRLTYVLRMSMWSNDTDKCYNIAAAAMFCLDTFLNYEDSSLPFCLQLFMYEALYSVRAKICTASIVLLEYTEIIILCGLITLIQ
jgi:hypothetical protein